MIKASESTSTAMMAGVAILLLTGLGACAGSAGPGPAATPSVQELARLQRSGLLDQERLECAIIAAEPLAAEVAADSRVLREVYRTRSTWDGRSHASSVQQGMADSHDAGLAARAALDARRVAQQATRDGDHTRAAVFSGYAAELLSPARDPSDPVREWRWSVSQRGAELDDDEADTFVEYAGLRAIVARSGPSAESDARVLTIERDAPNVIEVYAGLLLRLHEDPAVRCNAPGGM